MTLKFGQVKPAAVEPVVHRPIFALLARTSSRTSRVECRPLGCPGKVSIEEPDLAGLHIFGLKAWPCLPEKFLTISARKIGILNERNGRARIAAKPDIRRRSTVRFLRHCKDRDEDNGPQQNRKSAAGPCPTIALCHKEASLTVIDRSSPPFHFLMLLFLMYPSLDGRFRRSGRYARFANAVQFAQSFDQTCKCGVFISGLRARVCGGDPNP